MNDTEQLIKEALGKLAERTPHPGPTLNALRRKRKRNRSVFMIATVGMAAAVVLIFAGVIASDRYSPPNGGDAAAALMPGKGDVVLKYQPHWLPEGFVEGFRGVDGGSVVRTWVPADAPETAAAGDGPSIRVSSGMSVAETTGFDEVIVRGLKGRIQVIEQLQAAEVEWKAQDTLVVSVSGFGDARETALRVADSVRADAKVVYQPAFRLDDKPASEMGGIGPQDWFARMSMHPALIQVSPRTPQFDGTQTPLTVRGKPGFLAHGNVAVQDGNVWIVATGDRPVDELVKAVNEVELVPNLDTSWVRKK